MSCEAFYSKYLDLEAARRTGVEAQVKCPFHDDDTPSMSINMQTGSWRCLSRGAKGTPGGPAHFLMLLENMPFDQAKAEADKSFKRVEGKQGKFPFTTSDVAQWHLNLMENPAAATRYGWSPAILTQYQIGIKDHAITIPIFKDGHLVNVRFYAPRGNPKVKGVQGFNTSVWWPEENLKNDKVYIMEGEKDTLLALSLGLNAVTSTNGAGSFKPEWSKFFVGKEVVVCYDIDYAGVTGSDKLVKMVKRTAKSVRNIKLPITEPDNGDFTDYVLQGHSIQEFLQLEQDTETAKGGAIQEHRIPDEVLPVCMENAVYENLYYKRIKFKTRVTSKYPTPFVVPKIVSFTCHQDKGRLCKACMNNNSDGIQTITIDERQPELLSLIDCPNSAKKTALLKLAGLCCTAVMIEYIETSHIELVFVIPVIEEQEIRKTYDARPLYYLDGEILNNAEFEMEAIPVSHPQNQKLVFLGYRSIPSESSLDSFVLTPELIKELKIWRPLSRSSTTSTQTSKQTLPESTEGGTSTLQSI